jgi:hypothetical protein
MIMFLQNRQKNPVTNQRRSVGQNHLTEAQQLWREAADRSQTKTNYLTRLAKFCFSKSGHSNQIVKKYLVTELVPGVRPE